MASVKNTANRTVVVRPVLWLIITLLFATPATGFFIGMAIYSWSKRPEDFLSWLSLVVGLLLFGILAALKNILKPLWIRPRFEPAILVDLSREKSLTSFIKNLCSSIHTRFPNSVILYAEPTFFVQQGKS